ncbi:MAG TPA: bifunctional [glutamine synthetase] adenylyltransferase/[glutamine synthetase]-adenylyl-L-tyrosine phosphorylase [Roseiarcus sp.]|nr:bifunctional [glutamine synthetase] adenylyltransferase/[glutamine synthetase]-adenylyl-L-tyrosine phosphorylase [Roseiarcus sp.]
MSGPLTPPRPLRRAREAAPDARLLAAIRDHSTYLATLIDEDRARALRLLAAPPGDAIEAVVAGLDAARFADEAEAKRALRRAKRDTHLAVALADLSGRFDVAETTAALTRFADAAVRAALRFLLIEAARDGRLRLGQDVERLAEDVERNCGFVVLALGKHGGRELNYSSDIDLVVFYDPRSAALPEGAAPGPLFVRLTQRLARLLEQRTEDGYVLRVDLRLRPDPGATPVAMSLPSAASYYETLGQNWERAAMIKARPVAGDLALGADFLKELAPFIWRKYFDYAAIADIHAMKRQIHAVRGHEEVAVAGHDVKLGRGGIREIEFFVQTQQLIFGGRRPALRGARTLAMLEELWREGWVARQAVDELSSAYEFLRAVEHRLQMQADEQTQRLPVEDEPLARFARFCGYAGLPGFARDLTRHLRAVEKHYARLFEDAPKLDAEAGSLVFTGVVDDPETLATLKRLGFQRPEQATETIRGWHFGRRPAVRSARAREVLTELTPGLLAAFAGSGDPDAALDAFDAALMRMPAAAELMSILRSNGPLRELFGDLLGGAPRLAEVVVSRPHALDAVIDPGRAGAIANLVDEAPAMRRAEAYLAPAHDFEEALNRARDYAAEEKFLIGVRLISGALDADMAASAYSALAGALVAALLARVEAEFAAEHGRVAGGRVAVLAMGKLGSREMTAASDLDLIVIYDFAADAPLSDGRRALAPAVYYARLTQRLVAALTAPTKAGRLYEVDLRLRPSGRQGPLATSLAGFARYQREDAETWEHMALTRARIVAGDATLARDIAAVARETLCRRREPAALALDIADMRALIAREKGDKGAFDLKLAPGGLIDVEFLAQYLILAHAATHPQLLRPETRAALAQAAQAGLLSSDDGAALAHAHRLMTAVTQVLRLTLPDDAEPAAAAAGVKRRIAAAAGAPDFARLGAELAEARARVAAIFQRQLRPDDKARASR